MFAVRSGSRLSAREHVCTSCWFETGLGSREAEVLSSVDCLCDEWK